MASFAGESVRDAAAGGGARDASRLLAKIVNGCDLLQMEAMENNQREVARLIAQLGKLAMEASRQDLAFLDDVGSPLGDDRGAQARPRFRAAVTGILSLLEEVQRLSAEMGEVFRGEDLLALQVTALDLNGLANGDAKRPAPAPKENAPPAPRQTTARLLIVDDDEGNREILARLLRSEPWDLHLAASGREALARAQAEPFDLIMLDVLMPGMDGLTLLRRIRQDDNLRDVPVVMISGVDQTANVAACLELGAKDYVSKPFNPILLRARLNSALEHRRVILLEQERVQRLEEVLAELNAAHVLQEQLMASLLPGRAVDELKKSGAVEPRYYNDVTVVFTDFVDFTRSCSNVTAYELVQALNEYFTAFDRIVARYKLERLKTVGDAYIFVGGLTVEMPSHPNDAVLAALEMLEFAEERKARNPHWEMRVGINTGPVVSGVVGLQRLAFDIWGDTVNLAARIVAAGQPGMINVSEKTFQRVKELFACQPRGALPIKGDRQMEMFFVQKSSIPTAGIAAEEQERRFRDRYRSYFGYNVASLPRRLFLAVEAS